MNPQLTTRLRTLRLSGMVEALPARVAQAESAPLAQLDFFDLLVEDELARRADRLFDRRVKQAGLTAIKTLADFDWYFNPKLPKATRRARERALRADPRRHPVDWSTRGSGSRTSPRRL